MLIEYHKGSYVPVFTLREFATLPEEGSRREAPAAHPWKRIAVLPFADLSATSGQGYIADELTEELIYVLTQMPRVSSLSCSFASRSAPGLPILAVCL
ncbi:MAG: hypothetical protein LAP85_00405 [Acidobacteriia bacterium]|nr:hypothetical protein [Terriglobia bacterium]